MGKMNAFIVIPTYNEKENIKSLVTSIFNLGSDFRLVIVDDCSPDGTGKLADELAKEDSRVKVIHRPGKLGLGTAYIEGFQYALDHKAEYVLSMDGDLSHQPKYLPDFLKKIRDYDVVIGSRYTKGGQILHWGIHRYVLSYGANLLARNILRLKIKDCTSGFRCYRRELLETIAFSEIKSEGYSFLIEMIFWCHNAGLKIAETPITFIDRKRGKSKISKREIFRAVYTLLRLRLQSGSKLKKR